MEYEQYIGMNPVDYSDEELKNILNILEFEYGQIIADYSAEVKQLDTPDFDPYSFRGERKLNKIAKKYADASSDISILMEDIDAELAKREKFAEEQRYSGRSYNNATNKVDTDEFLEKEELRTLLHKQNIDKE